jgi:hypothetical protein
MKMQISKTGARFVRLHEVWFNKYWPQFHGPRKVTFRIIGTRDGAVIARRDGGVEVEFCLLP